MDKHFVIIRMCAFGYSTKPGAEKLTDSDNRGESCAPTMIYYNKEYAEAEAFRLARENPAETFGLFELMAECSLATASNIPHWTEVL